MRFRACLLAAVLLGSGLAAGVLAQPPGRPNGPPGFAPPPGRGNPPPMAGGVFGGDKLTLLAQKSVQDELNLTDKQQKQVESRLRKQRETLDSLREMVPEDAHRKLAKQSKSNDAVLSKLLTAAQYKRLAQISLQRRGAQALAEADIAKTLSLTGAKRSRSNKSNTRSTSRCERHLPVSLLPVDRQAQAVPVADRLAGPASQGKLPAARAPTDAARVPQRLARTQQAAAHREVRPTKHSSRHCETRSKRWRNSAEATTRSCWACSTVSSRPNGNRCKASRSRARSNCRVRRAARAPRATVHRVAKVVQSGRAVHRAMAKRPPRSRPRASRLPRFPITAAKTALPCERCEQVQLLDRHHVD